MRRWNALKIGRSCALTVAISLACDASSTAMGRPSVAHVGGGGGRAAVSRPAVKGSMPSARPNGNVGASRPSLGNARVPSGAQRPAVANRPGGFSPSGGRPSISFPTTQPGNASIGSKFPSPGTVKPATRPATLPGNIGAGSGNGGLATKLPTKLPADARPGLGNVYRPTTLPGKIERPTTLPGKIDHPTIGGHLPGGDRPSILPGPWDRPGVGNRPVWDRPPGGWRAGGWNRPEWGLGHHHWHHDWHDHWHDHCIHHHHHWYNGCWHGYWGSYWYAPFPWYAVGWGLGTWVTPWGYGLGYYNPYSIAQPASVVTAYDYTQPVVINNYVTTGEDGSQQPVENSPESEAALETFDEGLAMFRAGEYKPALAKFDAALRKLPGDAVVHEVRALDLFAVGEYQQAAAALNSLLSSAPGMDWTSISALYGNLDDYTNQLRALEQACKRKPQDAAQQFVLAYHYLATGNKDEAVSALQKVVAAQPKDATAKRMLDALTPAANVAAPPTDGEAPETDLVGKWIAAAGDAQVELSIGEDSTFSWKALQSGKTAAMLTGQALVESDSLSLETRDQGALAGAVTSLSPDKWRFVPSGAPPGESGLTFERAK